MASHTYPVKHPEGTLTTEQLHLLLSSPARIAKRVADVTKMRFIADYLLSGRFDASGGGVFYETGEDPFAPDDPRAVAPLGEYPKTILFEGETVAVATRKWGTETDISDEKVSRQGISYVNKSIARIANSVIRRVDSIAMAVIAAKVTSTFAAGAFTTAGDMVSKVEQIRGERADLGLGLDLNTIVLTPTQYAKVVKILVDSNALPRESDNPVVPGRIPIDTLGLSWAVSPHYTGANPLLIDRDQLGGMADEKLDSPDYSASGNIEIYSRREGNDSRIVRGRRVTVPVVTDPLAGVQLTGTGL